MYTVLMRPVIALLVALALTACGGARMLRTPVPLLVLEPLATASEEHLAVTLDAVIFRDGPGSWAKNVDWDEYLIRFRNVGSDVLQIDQVTVVDSLETLIDPAVSRSQLVRGTRETKRRYEGAGLKVQAGVNGAVLMGAGVAAAAGTSGVGTAAMAGGGAAVGAAAVVVMVPVLAVGGLVRGVNNSQVNGQIETRQTALPIGLAVDEEQVAHIFFPLSPSPLRVEVRYRNAEGDHTLILDTGAALQGLHLVSAAR